jgi:hypothetical protein
MLVSMPAAPFVAVKTVTCVAITIAAVLLTVYLSVRTAQREDLVLADARAA